MRGAGELLCTGAFDAEREGLFGLGTGNSECGFCVLGYYSPESAGIMHLGRITPYPRTGMPVRIAG